MDPDLNEELFGPDVELDPGVYKSIHAGNDDATLEINSTPALASEKVTREEFRAQQTPNLSSDPLFGSEARFSDLPPNLSSWRRDSNFIVIFLRMRKS